MSFKNTLYIGLMPVFDVLWWLKDRLFWNGPILLWKSSYQYIGTQCWDCGLDIIKHNPVLLSVERLLKYVFPQIFLIAVAVVQLSFLCRIESRYNMGSSFILSRPVTWLAFPSDSTAEQSDVGYYLRPALIRPVSFTLRILSQGCLCHDIFPNGDFYRGRYQLFMPQFDTNELPLSL